MGSDQVNVCVNANCVDYMRECMQPGSVKLAFADPPFNIGYKYDQYADARPRAEYLRWCYDWQAQLFRVLDDFGTYWLAIGDEYAAELKVQAQEIGFHCRSWVVWYYTFGVNNAQNFSRSHTHLFYFVKDEELFTFRFDDKDNRVPSKREYLYNDERANPFGRLPDNTWLFPRIAGTHKQRNKAEHGCQMPELVLARIINTCSEPGELVFDPFGGSGTTAAVAKKLRRTYLTTEVSEDYCIGIDERCGMIPADGAPIDGDEELIAVKREHIKGQPDKIKATQ